ncbi:MAG: DNA-directed RNA polymerase subunit beta, partial [Deltaproteobacteria bacterium]|nr:DNA-directed RNA polymerase subunit beta [Deltaproteobacteria bacterium]
PPYRGSWVDFEFDHKDILYVRIDRRRKMPATILLRALGLSTQEILAKFYKAETVYLKDHNKMAKSLDYDMMLDQRVSYGIYDPKTGEEIVKKNSKVTRQVAKKLRLLGVTEAPIEIHDLDGKILADDIVDEETGEILFECNEEVTKETIKALREKKIKGFSILYIDNTSVGPFLRNTLLQDKISTPDEAVLEIYRRLRPGEPSTVIQARNYFQNLFFNPARYDLSRVGRLKMNYKFNIYAPLSETTLKQDDFIAVVGYLLDLKIGKSSAKVDDIDHLGNRRIRAVGELMENQYRIGLVRMEKGIKEKMNMSPDIDTLMPHDLINAKPVSAVIKEYFGSSQLSQFPDQTNPLSEITHKRRLSALGPGGLTRDRAGFEVRDVHTTHYGRICPIETPEGPNIGLIASLSSYARVNEYGFIETPYRKVEDGKVT